MCGRFSFATTKEKIQAQVGNLAMDAGRQSSYNIAPTQQAAVITNDAPRRLQYFTWGLIPHWSNDGHNTGRLINARAEGIAAKPSFRLPIRNSRCLVLADSFYEWRQEAGRKVPYRIFNEDGRLLLMAGIWDTWHQGDVEVRSFSIITTAPNAEMRWLHNRMPLFFNSLEQQQHWLAELELDEVLAMLHPPADGQLRMYPVSDLVNSVKNDRPDLHLPVPETPTLF
jgi:putative SOS response-associated peptidase YedK